MLKFILVLSVLVFSSANAEKEVAASAIIESCRGCSLNRLPEVKVFIFEDVPQYNDVQFKHIQGAQPELVLLNDSQQEIERLPLSKLSRSECNGLLKSKGFYKTEL